MALALGKVTILIGAGVVGSVLAKEGRMPTTSDLFSGVFKSVLKKLGLNDSPAPNAKPKNDVWLKQVNSLREELNFYASSRPVTIVTSTSSGGRVYYVVVVIMVVGGYLWWKGWKLPDLMFATKNSLSKACIEVEKELQSVHSSIANTKQQVTSQLKDLDRKLKETKLNSEAAHRELCTLKSLLHDGDMKSTNARVESVLEEIKKLESAVEKFEGKQKILFVGIRALLDFVKGHEERRRLNQMETGASSRLRSAIGLPQPTPSRAGSVPSNLLLEPSSPSASTPNGQQKQGASLDTGLKFDLATNESKASTESRPQVSSEIGGSSESGPSGFGLLGGQSLGSVVTRSRSLKLAFNY